MLEDREITHAWGGPIDVAPNRLPVYRSRGALHAGWGFTGHGVGPSHLGGRILSRLALGRPRRGHDAPARRAARPPVPARAGSLARRLAGPRALIRKDAADERGEPVDPLTAAVARLPKLLGMNLPR